MGFVPRNVSYRAEAGAHMAVEQWQRTSDFQPPTVRPASHIFSTPATTYISIHVLHVCKTQLSNRNPIVRILDHVAINSYKKGYRNNQPIEGSELVVRLLVIVLLATRAHAFPSRILNGTIDDTTNDECPTVLG